MQNGAGDISRERSWTTRTLQALALALAALCCAGQGAGAEIGKGHRLLITNGLQIQACVTRDDTFHLETLMAANYTAVNWIWHANPAWLGTPPGRIQWGSWIGDEASVPPRPGEEPYMSRLVSLSLGDEWHINDEATRSRLVTWFDTVRDIYPDTILHHNNWGTQIGDANLVDFIQRARPDMLCFDTYPWRLDYATRVPLSGSPTAWYTDLRRYRVHAVQNGLPLGTYRQTFHAIQDYDKTAYRDPSPAELWLNTLGALAFGVTFFADFTYNTGASSLFTPPGGDSTPTALYHELARVNAEARNLGKALVHMTPLDRAPNGARPTTDVLLLRGQTRQADGTAALNPLPNGFVPDAESPATSDWRHQRNDPWLTGWTWRNLGEKNDGLPGDVIVAWFRPLDETLSSEIYLMVVNGLVTADSSPRDCRQRVTLDFRTEMKFVQILSRRTAEVQVVPLTILDAKKRLTLDLNGGSGELLKLDTGLPFVH